MIDLRKPWIEGPRMKESVRLVQAWRLGLRWHLLFMLAVSRTWSAGQAKPDGTIYAYR